MNGQKNIEAVQKLYAALGDQDVAAFLDCSVDDLVYVVPGPPNVLPWAGTMRGKPALKRWIETAMSTIEFECFEPRQYLVSGETVVVLAWERYFPRASPDKVIENECAFVYTVRDGKLATCPSTSTPPCRWRCYNGRSPAARSIAP